MQGSPELTDMTNSINDLSEVIRLTHENLEQETKRLTSILSYMTDGVLATNRRGQIIMVNEMAAKQLNVNPDEVLNTSILDLLSLGDWGILKSSCALCFDSSRVRFYLWSGSCFARYDRAGQGRAGASPLCLQCES